MFRYAHSHRAFTLIEFLVVMAVVALLVGLLLPVLGEARSAARQARGMSDLRQLLLGYTVYQSDHDGRVLWGYTPPTIAGKPVEVHVASGHIFGLPVADRYPWRMASYVDDIWEVLHGHGPTPPQPVASDAPSDAVLKAYALSLTPTFGINSAYVGGHHGPTRGFVLRGGEYQPNRGQHVVFRQDEARRPSDLIVFAESQARVGTSSPFPDEPAAGFHAVTAPRAGGQHWRAVGGRIENLRPSTITGLPEGRHSDATVTGFFDGHAAGLRADALDNMRLWANGAQAADDDPVP